MIKYSETGIHKDYSIPAKLLVIVTLTKET